MIMLLCLCLVVSNKHVWAADSNWWEMANSSPSTTTASSGNWWDMATGSPATTTAGSGNWWDMVNTGTSTSVGSGSSAPSIGKVELPNLPTWGLTWDIILQNVYSIIAYAVGIALVITMLVGGIMYITSAGNEEQASKGAKTVTAAVVGFIMIALAYGIIVFVSQAFK